MTLKVSVVVPTYKPGKGIDRVISSIQHQTLSPDEFELILVDDGSPDDTFRRLEQIRDTHTNVRIERIENSGWPSRPRNVGVEMARGEYVLFMDHDDYLYPDALRASYAYAKENNADVLSPKESKTTDIGWGITNFTANIPNARESRGISALLPMMPHKFYRREFLNDHNIRFPEGRRMLWEDVYFNVEAYRHAAVISILSDTPVYRWVHTGTNNSATYGPESTEFWSRLTQLFEFIAQTLPGEEFAGARQTMIAHQYRTRLLGRFDQQLATGSDEGMPEALRSIRHIIEEFVPLSIDKKLGKVVQPRSYLMREQQVGLMRQLRDVEAGIAGITRTDSVKWGDGELAITATTRWIDPHTGGPLRLYEDNGRIFRRLTPELEAAIPRDLLDVTDAVAAAATHFTIRSRSEHVTWPVSTHSTVNLDRGDDASVEVTVTATATVRLDNGAFGRPIEGAVWDVHARNTLMGMSNHRAVRAGTRNQPALMHGRGAVAYKTRDGMLAIDFGGNVRSVVDDGTFLADQATMSPQGPGLKKFAIPMDDVATFGRTELTGTVGFQPFDGAFVRLLSGPFVARVLRVLSRVAPRTGRLARKVERRTQAGLARHPARIVGDSTGVRLEGRLRLLPGSYSLICRFSSRSRVMPVRIRVSATGRATFVPR